MSVLTTDFEQPTMDDYPTRKDPSPALLFRRDPTVWGDADGGPLDGAELARFEEKGYLQSDPLLTPDELATYRAELDRLRADPDLRGDERVVTDPETGEVRTVFAAHRVSAVFDALVRDPRIVGRARQILGSDVYVHQSRVNHAPGFSGTDLFWHSDFETWHAEDGMPRMRAVGISIALTEEHAHNGALMVIPGSHRTFVSCLGEDGLPDHGSLSILTEMHGIDVLSGPEGGVTVLDGNAMHGSNGNITPHARANVFVVFNSVENTCGDPFTAPRPRPEYRAARDFTPIE
jgi:ectoine hydroxylase